MFASRPHDMPRLPSFDELMHSIIGQPLPNVPQTNKQHIARLGPDASPRPNTPQNLWGHQTDFRPQLSVLQHPHPLSVFPTTNYQTGNSNFSPSSTTMPDFPSPSSSVTFSSSSSPASIALSGSPTVSAGSTEAVSPEAGEERDVPSAGAKRSHICKTCGRPFTTSGHLARHNRIHTGERNHKCPFPNCNARFARQDNCTQHYRTHLNGKSKRSRGKKVKS
ncbi:hypothetical protein JCM33374_g6368 [Metschnikowia sp. JCM 33374]|nr:hypothetical protein JCM33374_g6368 [Metschnikowia sp. JCM 33374]